MKRIRLFLVLAVMALLALSPGKAVANELFNSSWYTMSASADHLNFKVLIADLVGRDDWVVEGRVKAYSQYGQKGTCLNLFNVWTVDQSNTSVHRIYGTIDQDGALARLNRLNSGADHLTNGSNASWIYIDDSKHNYPQVNIDFYWAPVMGSKTWYFYFEGKSDEGDKLTYYLGSSACSNYLGRPSMDVTAYKCERKNSTQLEFSVPGKPSGSAAPGYQMHEGWYDVTFTYRLYSGQTVTERKTFTCEAGQRKVYDVTIPVEAGNFRSLDLTVTPTDAYKNTSNGQYYYKNTKTYNNSNVLPTVPMPNGIVAEYRQFDAKIDLSWNSFVSEGAVVYSYVKESVPYIYRVETDESGKPLSGQKWKKLDTMKEVASNKSFQYSDNGGIQANTYYKYMVVNVPKAWIKADDIATAELNNPADAFSAILKRLGYAETQVVGTSPTVDIFDFVQSQDVTDKVLLQWHYSRVPGVSGNVSFDVWRAPKGSDTWTKIGSTISKANPDANTVATFTDEDLSNEKVRYDYKVQLSINSGKNIFESDVLTAGLLEGTSLKDFVATKGTHENSVQLQWAVHQVGTDNTNFDIYRRYVGGENSDWMMAHSVSGHSDSYTYEDKTVRPGYYYEYKVEAYSGEKASDDTHISSLKSIGFCQARGVVSGRISFATGNTAVGDVRVTLRSGEDGDNAIRGYSQRVDGASTGIAWEAGAEEIAKVFGSDKNYTVQFFVRPDEGLGEGAVIGEIPGVGQLVTGPLQGDSYQLYCKKDVRYHVVSETYWESVNQFRAFYEDSSISEDKTYGDDTVYTSEHGEAIEKKWKNEGYNYKYSFAASWIGTNCTLKMYRKVGDFTEKQKGYMEGLYYDLGISLSAGVYSLLTVQSSKGAVTVSVNDNSSSTMTFVKTSDYKTPFEQEAYSPSDLVMHNGRPVYFGGTLMKALAITNWAWEGRLNVSVSASAAERTCDYDASTDAVEAGFSVGGAQTIMAEEGFRGNLADVRVWDHLLTDKERANYNDRSLSGRESGLKLYWPMDEGQNRLVFDASYSNDVPNGRHATVGHNVSTSVVIPEEEQLSRYGLTNESGEYTIRGIPFVGSGTTYTFTPTKGIHTFSPASRNGFISAGSLALNGYDFSDESSFPMYGTVTYQNTNIPVDSVQFKIDGTLAQNKKGVLMSDANGRYEISVPIGNHRVEAWKNGHRLTSFPLAEGETHDFVESVTVNFVDSTLVNVTGRINGGFTDKDEPLGFGRSKNRIGQATVKLSLGREAQSSFNYIRDEHNSGSYGLTDLPVESATPNIASTAWRGAGSADENSNTRYIYIKTDPATGEFSALLPPLNYKVEQISFDGDTKDDKAIYNNMDFFTQNLPMIDATCTNTGEMQRDSLVTEGGITEYYIYSGKLLRQLRNEPSLTVTQDNMKNGAFGMDSLVVQNMDDTTDKVAITEYTADGFSYNYGYPMFSQNESYNMTIGLAEEYINVDTKETFTEIPADATIHIANEGSISTAVIAEKCTVGDKEMQPGEVYAVSSIEATPDEKGLVKYSWIAGLPNLAGEHLRTLTISAKVDGRTTVWKPKGSGSATGLDFVALGGIITGTNFVTGGPDHVDMILRRPPGSTAYASWTIDTIRTDNTSRATFDSHSGGGGIYTQLVPVFKSQQGTPFFSIITEIAPQANHTVTRSNISEDTNALKKMNSYTISETKKTPSGNTYTQRDGDTFIGRATNLLFGKGEAIGLYKQSDGTYKIDQKETICTGETFTTTFIYAHQYIEDVLLPNWQKLIDNFLTHYDGDLKNAPAVKGKMMYYTNYSKGDEAWGKANSDADFWTREQISKANGMPGYRVVNGLEGEEREQAIDSVEWCANQISTWKYWLAQNEEDKLEAFKSSQLFDKNYSIAGGTNVSQTTKNSKSTSKVHTVKSSVSVNNETHAGVLFNNAGAYAILKFNDSWGTTTETTGTEQTDASFNWQISDAEPTTALSVDVYESPGNWGPIFRTRGGQTSNPYENATYTRYFNPGTQLDEATMRVEKPELSVKGAVDVTDVPTGGKARFNLQLYNASETNTICTYVLEAKDKSNPNGAKLIIDGTPLSSGSTGRTVKMKGGELIEKLLEVEQSDRSIIDYENIQLVLKSAKDTSTVSTPVVLSVHFVPSSAIVEMKVDHTVLNQELYVQNKGVLVTLQNLDRQDQGLAGMRVRYRRKGTDSWTVDKEWYVKPEGSQTQLPETDIITAAVKFPEDGLYEVQAQTFGTYGTKEVTYQTDIIEVTQDTHGPKLLGMVSPESGLLTYVNRNNMHLRFNEVLNANGLSKSDNFRIEGNMNNVVSNGTYPDVAVRLNGERMETDAMYSLSNTDYAFDMWFYRQGDGTIISLGTDNNLLSLSTHNDGVLCARVGTEEDVYDTGVQLPKDKWLYMALNYKRRTSKEQSNYITMLYATADDDRPNFVGKDVPAKDLDGHGKLGIGGDGMQGMISELSVWNSDISAEELFNTRRQQRPAYTPGLVGYWNMDEGHGTQITDRARSRHFHMPVESWYINNKNLAAKIDFNHHMPIDISTFSPSTTDNYAIEMWFRGEEEMNASQATLFSVLDGLKVGYDDGKLKLQVVEQNVGEGNVPLASVKHDVVLSEKTYLDNSWHHFALNVRRGTSAIAYIDGEPVKVIPENIVPGLNGQYLQIGGFELKPTRDVGYCFTGDVDEIRIWSAALDGQLIAERMYERIDSGYPGLVGYFPMESISRNEQGTVTTGFSTKNFGEKNSQLAMMGMPESTTIAPALKPGSSKMRLDDTQFSFTASSDEIYFSFPDSSLPLMDGNDFVAKVNYIKDDHGNNSETVEWMFHADFAAVRWSDLGVFDVVINKPWDVACTWSEYLYNKTGVSQSYEISGLPSWMTVDKAVGVIDKEYDNVSFTIGSDVPVGHYVEYIYVTDRLGIQRVLQMNINVTGNEPDWAVDPDLYESNMMLTGQVYVDGKISEFTDTRVAAFDDRGRCRGVASPEYVSTRDAFYVNMVVYGASATEISTGETDLSFKLYDASTGRTYPVVNVTLPGKEPSTSMRYAQDAIFGSYDYPVVFTASDLLEQDLLLPQGWSWVSIYVQPESTAISDVLPVGNADRKKFQNIKSHEAIASVRQDNGAVVGTLKSIVPGNMYKVQMSSPLEYSLIGSYIPVRDTEATIYSGWNWIGTLSNNVMSVRDAFADLDPTPGDVVKNRTSFSSYRGSGVWEGTLKTIVPGQGYIYNSKATSAKTFRYPQVSDAGNSRLLRAPVAEGGSQTSVYTPVDPHLFPDNMNMIAVVKNDGEDVENAEIGAFVNDMCRGAAVFEDGYYFLTVMGSSADDLDNEVVVRISVGGKEYEVEHLHFVSDALYGTLEEPYVLELKEATGIATAIAGDGDDTDWWTLQGFRIGRRPSQPGVYVHNGRKVTVKGKVYGSEGGTDGGKKAAMGKEK